MFTCYMVRAIFSLSRISKFYLFFVSYCKNCTHNELFYELNTSDCQNKACLHFELRQVFNTFSAYYFACKRSLSDR